MTHAVLRWPWARSVRFCGWAVLLFLLLIGRSVAQSIPLSYQGRLTESGNPATGTYLMQFRLFDTPLVGTGTLQGTAITIPDVSVKDGEFSALLDFGVAAFDGTPRYLEISVKPAASPDAARTLTPRQAITPVPYAIRSLGPGSSAEGVVSDGSGNVAIGTNAFPPGVRLNVGGVSRFSAGGSGGDLQIGTPGGETGLSMVGGNRLDLRFNGHTAVLAAGPNAGPTPYQNGIVLNTNGNVGIGMGAPFPASTWKLEVNGPTRITPVGPAGGAIQFSVPNGETGMSLIRANRADVRFDDSTLKLVAGPGNGPPGNSAGLAITTGGNVGVGTTTPGTTLDVAGDITGTRLFLRADPFAPKNAAVLCQDGGVEQFVPYNTALNRAMSLLVHDASVRTLEIRGGADLAEPFLMKEQEIEKGSVVVIDDEHPGQLTLSTRAYDRRVAGIVSGANGINTGISLRQEGLVEGSANVALSGRVYVRADATGGEILPGDLLTTSDTPGCAMKVTDHARSQGAVLGKAMSPLKRGQGMVLVLVTLQ